MKYLKPFRVNESTISKSYIVDRIKWYSDHLHQYMVDVNHFTTSNLNFSFSYNTELTISQIFEAADKLEHNSPDGFITAICNEFITWSEYMINNNGRVESDLIEFRIDKGYVNFSGQYKEEHKHELYNQQKRNLIYAATGRDIKKSISGTIWDLPMKRKFIEEDNEFIIDSLISDFDVDNDYILRISNNTHYKRSKRGIIYNIPYIKGETLTYDSDFIKRLQSYFSGVLILERGAYNPPKLYFPFLF